MGQHRAQKRIVSLLDAQLGNPGFVNSEVAFRPVPEYEVWVADVVFVSAERYASTPPDTWLKGAPDLVVEVLSPSDTADEMQDREEICLRNGAIQFWTVSLERRTIKVTTAEGRTAIFRRGDEIDLAGFGGGKFIVAAVSAG